MYLRSLTLDHIKTFEEIHLDFRRPGEHDDQIYAGMTCFVGGNSSGKSTLLKSIAVALAGPTVANQLLVSPLGWIRRGATKALIEADIQRHEEDTFKIKGGTPFHGTTFKAGIAFETEEAGEIPTLREKPYTTPNRTKVRSAERRPWHPDSSGWLLGAYGPLRRLTGSSTEALTFALGKGKLASCVTLFREDAALSES